MGFELNVNATIDIELLKLIELNEPTTYFIYRHTDAGFFYYVAMAK